MSNTTECIEDAMRQLVGALHRELLDTGLVTPAQWNTAIAPRLSAVAMAIEGAAEPHKPRFPFRPIASMSHAGCTWHYCPHMDRCVAHCVYDYTRDPVNQPENMR